MFTAEAQRCAEDRRKNKSKNGEVAQETPFRYFVFLF